nr:hypothetical protein [Mycoplasmopsis bovis]
MKRSNIHQFLICSQLSKEDIKKNWGTSGLTSISELVTGDNFQKFLANNTKLLFGDNYTDSNSGSNSQKPKEINLFNEIEKIKVEIDKFVNNKNGNGVDSSSSGGSSGNGNETVLNNEQAAEYNTKAREILHWS